jgi:TetR/AcrR family transcriptional regulator
MPTPKPRASRDATTEARILDAARRAFTRRGTAGARMQEIADDAGVNSALLYYYFTSKEALAERVFLDAAGRLVQALAPLAATGDSIEALVRGFVHSYIDTVRQVPFLPAYILAEMHQHPARMTALMARVFGSLPSHVSQLALGRVSQLLDAGIGAGTLRRLTPRQVMVSVMALTVMPFAARPLIMTAFKLDDDEFERFLDERKAELPGFILNGLRP